MIGAQNQYSYIRYAYDGSKIPMYKCPERYSKFPKSHNIEEIWLP